ncbi:MAG: VWA domain-containing protein [Acidobacteria bacterium]|nr:VWA domain-containing protein [Acidobacteriota bacterium]
MNMSPGSSFLMVIALCGILTAYGTLSPARAQSVLKLSVHVTDEFGRPVTGLTTQDFKITLDNRHAVIGRFVENDDPASVLFIVDNSGSMQIDPKSGMITKYWAMKIRDFIYAGNPENEYGLIVFNKEPRVIMDWTSNDGPAFSAGLQQLIKSESKAKTSLFDAIDRGMGMMKSAGHKKRAIIIISDGNENGSRIGRFRDLRKTVRNSDVSVYTINVANAYSLTETPKSIINYLTGTRQMLRVSEAYNSDMTELVNDTGGINYSPVTVDQVALAFDSLGAALRHQYSLTLTGPSSIPTGNKNGLKIQLSSGNPLLKNLPLRVAFKVN